MVNFPNHDALSIIIWKLQYLKNRKGTWDALDGADLEDVPDALDENDPNYDDFAEESKYILSSSNGNSNGELSGHVDDRKVYGPMLTLAEFKIRVSDCILEYFDSADADEVIRSIEEMKCKEYHPEVVKKAISLSLDKNPKERELVSKLLTYLHPFPLDDFDVEKGFEILLESLEDLCIDIPDARVSMLFTEHLPGLWTSCRHHCIVFHPS